MASSLSKSLLLLSAFFCFLVAVVFAAASSQVYVVGGDRGWTLPSRARLDYGQWAANVTFKVGDSLEFNYAKAAHSVLEVIRSGYRYCNTSNPIASFQDGKTLVKLSNPGSYYFICGVPGHCEAGQKFMVKVAGHITLAPASSPAMLPALAPSPEISPVSINAIPPATADAAPALFLSSVIAILIGVVIVGFMI